MDSTYARLFEEIIHAVYILSVADCVTIYPFLSSQEADGFGWFICLHRGFCHHIIQKTLKCFIFWPRHITDT